MYADTYFILDFDRCLGDTDGIQALLEKVIRQETGVSTDELHEHWARNHREGRTPDTIRLTHKLLKESGVSVGWEELREKLVAEAQTKDLLLPHARELLTILRERNLPHGIITFGVEEAWQLTKLELTGLLTIPHLVTHIETKGELLTGWKQADGKFVIPAALLADSVPVEVSNLVFIDDKAKSFWGVPDGVRGVHVIAPGGNKLLSQQGETPPSVTDVTGIDGAIELLFE